MGLKRYNAGELWRVKIGGSQPATNQDCYQDSKMFICRQRWLHETAIVSGLLLDLITDMRREEEKRFLASRLLLGC